MHLIFIVALCLFSSSLKATDRVKDSLALIEVNKYRGKVEKALYTYHWDKVIAYADTMYYCAEETGNEAMIYSALTNRWKYHGDAYLRQGDTKTAYEAYQKGLATIRQLDMDETNKNRSICMFYIGLGELFSQTREVDSINAYAKLIFAIPTDHSIHVASKQLMATFIARQGQFSKALEYGYLILEDARMLENKPLEYDALALIAGLYDNLESYSQFMLYVDTCLQVARATKDSSLLIEAYDDLGIGASKQGYYEEAVKWLKKAMAISEFLYAQSPMYERKSKDGKVIGTYLLPLADIYQHLANTYLKLDRLDSAELFLSKALTLNYQYQSAREIVPLLGDWVQLCLEQERNYEPAIDSLRKAYRLLPTTAISRNREVYILQQFGQVYQAMNQADSALVYFKKAEEAAKKLENASLLASSYELLEFFYKKQGNTDKAYAYQNLKIEQDTKRLNEVHKKEMAALEVKYELGHLRETNDILEANNQLKEEQLAFSEQLNRRNQFLIAALVFGIVLIFILGMVLYHQKSLNEQVKVMKLEQKALKAQINPHFFFNVLNSLQGIILSESPMEAYRYHSKFTQLMRLVLMQSEEESISLEEELKALKLYIELEQLRTGNAFDFAITVDLDEQQEALVPSMLLQPFVENAIWHGVMNRPEGAEKHIDIRVQAKENYIVCEIEDTGVGRVVAAQIKAQKTNQHKSMGIQVTQDRLELFRLRHQLPLTFKVEDILDAQQNVTGTKVSLDIPVLV